MIILKFLIWIWAITFLVDIIWYQYNPNAIKSFYEKTNNLQMFSYSFYYMIIHIVTLIAAPIILYYIIIGELNNYLILFKEKRQLRKKIKKIKDKEIKKQLKEAIKKIKY
jgi:biopolymer transport protein ExbB/TolQ